MIKQVLPADVYEKLKSGKGVSIIDVREDNEVAKGMIPGARHIPLGEVEDRMGEIDKDQEHIMVCQSGGRSGKAAETLNKNGFKVQNMVGGMTAWEAQYKDEVTR